MSLKKANRCLPGRRKEQEPKNIEIDPGDKPTYIGNYIRTRLFTAASFIIAKDFK